MRKVLILLTICFALPMAAQWRRAGLYGADVRALIADPAAPDTLYLGTSGGEVYSSHDGGVSWISPRNGIPFPNYVVDNLTVDRNGRLWAACWGLWGGGVIAVSADGGRTWERRDAGLEDFSVRAIAIDPNDGHFIIAGGLTGVYRSKNDGRTWDKISDQINVESLAVDPRNRDRIFVGTWRQGWRTDDGGANWKQIAEGMVLDTDMFSITIDDRNPDNIWVATCGWVVPRSCTFPKRATTPSTPATTGRAIATASTTAAFTTWRWIRAIPTSSTPARSPVSIVPRTGARPGTRCPMKGWS